MKDTIWEEKNLIEPLVNCENKNESEINDITPNTEKKFSSKEWNAIGKVWKRNCPKCGRDILYKSKYRKNLADKLNIICVFCRNKNNKPSESCIKNSVISRKKLKELHKEKLKRECPMCKIMIVYEKYGTWWSAKKYNTKCKKCQSEKKKKQVLSEETKKKISNSRIGEKHWFFGKKHSDEYKKNMSLKVSGEKNGFWGRKHTEETKIKIGEKSKERFEKSPMAFKMREYLQKNKTWMPFFNFKPCNYFDKLNKESNCNIQHSLNGGEYNAIGYFADGYDSKNNIWYEWDESHHFDIDGNLLEPDVQRMEEIRKRLNCRFVRIKDSTEKEYLNLPPIK